jgi:outer membrane usher protein
VRAALAALVALVATLIATPAAAQEQAIWALVLNDEPQGDITVVLRADGPWVDPAALAAAGVQRLPAGRRQVFPPLTTPFVSLVSLAPNVNFTLDEQDIRLVVTVDPSLLGLSAIAISNPRPPGWQVRSNAATFLNYSANWSSDSTTTGYGEFGLHVLGGLLQTAATIDQDGAITPGLSNLSYDQLGSRRRWTIGDTIGHSTTLGSTPVVGGAGIMSQSGIDPYYATFAGPQFRGAVRAPSIAEVYVDGRLASTVRLSPGRFILDDLPIEAGLGSARVVIRDTLGRTQEFDLGFYLSTQLLKRGEHSYSYVAGKERNSDGTTVTYDRPLAAASHQVGLTDWLTIGFQGEGAKDIVSGGGGFMIRLWRLGVFGAEAAASQAQPEETPKARGLAGTGAYSFMSRLISLDMRATWIGPQFQNLYLEPANKEQLNADATATLTMGWLGSLTVGATIGDVAVLMSRTRQRNPDFLGRIARPPRDALTKGLSETHDKALRLGYMLNLTRWAQLSANATRIERRGRPITWEGFGSLTIALGWRTVASAVTSVDEDSNALTTVSLQRSLPLGPGFGFRIDADAQEPYRTRGTFEVQHQRGIVGVRADGANGADTVTTVNVAGSLVGIGGEVLLSRPVQDGFALVKVPQARRVRVLANNQPVGRTGRRGSLFVPDLRSYLSSPIAIDQDDLPVEVRLGDINQDIAVRYRGGAVVTFETESIRAVFGRLDTGGDPPAYGTLSITVGDRTLASPLNADGEFYFEDLPAGEYAAVATWRGQSCRATVRMPDGKEPMTDVGKVPCATGQQ